MLHYKSKQMQLLKSRSGKITQHNLNFINRDHADFNGGILRNHQLWNTRKNKNMKKQKK